MPDRACTALIVLLAGVVFAADARGQRPPQEDQRLEDQYLTLSGLSAVKARVTVQWDMAVTMRGGTTLADFERNLRSAFELGLGDAGIGRDEAASARLDCVVGLMYLENGEGTVVLSRTVRLLKRDNPKQPLGRWTVGWSRGETYETRRDALSGSEAGLDCAAAFERDWRRANP